MFFLIRQPKKNVELVQSIRSLLAALRQKLPVDIHWVAGHVGTPGNEKADQLANSAVEKRCVVLHQTTFNSVSLFCVFRSLLAALWHVNLDLLGVYLSCAFCRLV